MIKVDVLTPGHVIMTPMLHFLTTLYVSILNLDMIVMETATLMQMVMVFVTFLKCLDVRITLHAISH